MTNFSVGELIVISCLKNRDLANKLLANVDLHKHKFMLSLTSTCRH